MIADANQPIAGFYSVRMMLAQLVVVTLIMITLYLLPLTYGAIVLTLLYGVLLVSERRLSIRSPITLCSFLLSATVLVLNKLVSLDEYGIYVSTVYFGMLFLIGVVCLLRKHPASLYYDSGKGSIALHWWTSSLWVMIYAVGLVISLLVPQRPDLYLLLPVLPMVGVLLTLWLQLVSMGSASRRQKIFSFGGFRFEQIRVRKDSLLPFYTHFVREAAHTLKMGERARRLSLEQLLQLKIESDMPSWPRICFFVAYEGDEVVGTISCMMKTRAVQLGLESEVSDPVKLDHLAQYGPVIEVGRFSIAGKYRLRSEVIQGLLRSVIEYAFEHDVAFMVTQAYQSAMPIYSKIGFQKISGQVAQQNSTGSPVVLMVFNLAKRAVCDLDDTQASYRLEGSFSRYLSERYFKRQSLRSIFRFKRAWTLSNTELSRICLNIPITDLKEERQHGT